MKLWVRVVAVTLIAVLLVGCATHVHVVGKGAQGNHSVSKKQWYVLWGLVPINDVQTSVMAEGATDYTIKTEQNFVDVLIWIVLGNVTLATRTVTVTK